MRAYKLRFYPSGEQTQALAQWFGHARWIWNWALDARCKAYARRSETLTSVDLSRVLTRIKRSKARSWLADVPRSCLKEKLRDLDTAYRNLFAGRARPPRFKSRHDTQSVRVGFDQRHSGKVRAWLDGRVVLAKLGALKLRGRMLPTAMPSLVTVTRDAADRYWVSFVVDEHIAPAGPALRESIGVDLGITHLATLSTGEHVANPRALQRHLEQLKRLQQRLARQRRGSNRRRRTRKRIARVHARIRNIRQDALHKLTTRLVHENQVIAIEDLGVEGMGRSARGTRETPGRNVKAKSGLNRSLKDAAFGEFRRQVTYKADWHQRTVVPVSRWFPSSQLCSQCGSRTEGLKLNERQWRCSTCRTEHDRDENASGNIEAEGLRLNHPGEPGQCAPLAARGNVPPGTGPVAVSARIGSRAA